MTKTKRQPRMTPKPKLLPPDLVLMKLPCIDAVDLSQTAKKGKRTNAKS